MSRWRKALAALALLLLVPAGAALWLLGTNAGARNVLAIAGTYSGRFEIQGLGGTLLGPLSFERLVYDDGTTRVEARDGDLDWSPRALRERHIAIARLAAAFVDVRVRVPAAPVETSSEPSAWTYTIDIAQAQVERLRLDLHASVPPTELGAVMLRGQVTPQLARVDALRAQLHGGRLQGSGHFGWAPQTRAAFDVVLKDATLRGYPLSAAVKGQLDGAALRVDAARLDSGVSRLDFHGSIWPRLEAQGLLSSTDLASLWPGLSGSIDARLQAHGTPTAPAIEVEAQARKLRYAGLALEQGTLRGRVDLAGASQARLALQGIEFDGSKVQKIEATLSGRVEQHQVQLSITGAQGQGEFGLRGATRPDLQRWHGELVQARLAPDGLAAWRLERPAPLEATRNGVMLRQACWRSAGARACVDVQRVPRGQRLDLQLEAVALAYLQPFLPADAAITGALSGTGQVTLLAGRLAGLALDLHNSAGEWRSSGARLAFGAGRARIVEDPRSLRAEVQLPLEHGAVELDAVLAPAPAWAARPLSGELRLDIPELGWLASLSPEVDVVRGRIDGSLQLGGQLGAPHFTGALLLHEGSARLIRPGLALTGIQGAVRARSGRAALDLEVQAQSGGGTLRLSGEWNPRSEPMLANLKIQGESFQAANLPEIRAWVSPDLSLASTADGLHLAGTLGVPRAQITPATLDRGQSASADQVLIGVGGADGAAGDSPRSLLKITSEVQLVLGDDVQFDGLGLKTRLAGALAVSDVPGRATSARGQVNLVGGRYKAYGQDLSLKTGRLIFNGGPVTDPAVEIRAERKPREDVTVGVTVRGRLDAPEFTLFSTPSMPQQNQLSWLVLGRPLETAESGQERGALAGAALALGLTGGDYLAQRLRGGLKLDEISIGARPGDASDTAKLTLGKYISPRIFISYGLGLFQPSHSFRLLYDIGRGFKLQTESGVESGGDLLYTIER